MSAALAEPDHDDQTSVLRWVRERRRVAQRAEAEMLEAAVAWAAFHAEDSLVGPADSWDESLLPLAGEGAPEVAEFCIAEFAAVLGRTTESGRLYVGDALELAHRLPGLYGRTQDGSLEVWRARQIAQATRCLPPEGAAFIDEHLVAVAHKVGRVTIGRLVDEALVRFDPEQARERAEAAAERRKVDVHRDDFDHAGLADVVATTDLTDADDFEAAISRRATWLGEQGDTDSLDVRRAKALGDMARADLGLDLETGTRAGAVTSGVELRVHTTQSDLEAAFAAPAGPGAPARLARIEKTRAFVDLDSVRRWLGRPDVTIAVRQVIDTRATLRVDQYEIPDRLRTQIDERDGHCAFPHCNRPAHSSDTDHIESYDDTGPPGQTSSYNLAKLCRSHHRLKTFSGWTYQVLERGHYLWTSPRGYRFLVTPTGTTSQV